jgi:hypothetical protein
MSARPLRGTGTSTTLGVVVVFTMLGCRSSQPDAAKTVTARDFATPAVTGEAPSTPAVGEPPAPGGTASAATADASARLAPGTRIGGQSAPLALGASDADAVARSTRSDEPLDLGTMPGPPADLGAAPSVLVDSLVIDANVGQINGEPVYASRFFEESQLDGRLTRLAVETGRDRAKFTASARVVIQEALQGQIDDALVLAEARASLTPQQRQGLFNFLNDLQGELVSQRGGSAVAAEQELRETVGRGVAAEAQQQLDQQLIRMVLRSNVLPRVNVTRSQVRRAYEREEDLWNPKATAVYRLIVVPTDNATGVQEVTDALASDTAFEEVARLSVNSFNRLEGGERTVEFRGAAPATDAKLFAAQALDDAARTLAPGQTVGPIAYADEDGTNPRTAWIHLEGQALGRVIPLYDAQLPLERALREQRLNEQRNRYLQQLRDRGSFTKIEDMRDHLVAIAVERYFTGRQ